MSNCDFCDSENTCILKVCCDKGESTCYECLLTRNVNTATMCSICQRQIGKKTAILLNQFKQMKSTYPKASNPKSNMARLDLNMEETTKKVRGMNNHEFMPQQSFPYYNQNYNYPHQNMNFNYPPPPYQPYPNNFCNNWGQGLGNYGQMPMNTRTPHYHQQQGWHDQQQEYHMRQSLSNCDNQFQYDTMARLLKSSDRRIMPHNVQEDEQNAYTVGKHSIGATSYQNKTTDFLQQASVRNKTVTRLNRSNSLNAFNLKK